MRWKWGLRFGIVFLGDFWAPFFKGTFLDLAIQFKCALIVELLIGSKCKCLLCFMDEFCYKDTRVPILIILYIYMDYKLKFFEQKWRWIWIWISNLKRNKKVFFVRIYPYLTWYSSTIKLNKISKYTHAIWLHKCMRGWLIIISINYVYT